MRLNLFILLFILIAVDAFSQEPRGTIAGTIISSEQKPIRDVSIRVKHTNSGTSTNKFGKYYLKAAPGDTISISCVGFTTQEFVVTHTPELKDLTLQRKSSQLDEVEISARRLRTQESLLFEYLEQRRDNIDRKGSTRFDSRQFFLEEGIQGKWIVNFINASNPGKYPSYLELTIYRKFNLGDQSQEIKVFRISDLSDKFQLCEIEQ